MEIARLIFGLLAGLAGAVGAGLYIWSIWQGESKPEFWTWMIFGTGVTGAVIYGLQGHPGLSGAIFPIALAALIDLIFVHTWFKRFRYQEGVDDKDEKLVQWWHKLLVAPLALIAYGLLIGLHWSPLVGVFIGIGVDFSALIILALKSWRKPNTEDWPAYTAGAVGGVSGLAALQNWNFTTFVFPLYFAVTEAAIVYILLRRAADPVPRVARA
jgi:hypothetical protein